MAKGLWRRVTPEVRGEIIRLAAKGWSQAEIVEEVQRSIGSVYQVLRAAGGVVRHESLAGSSPDRLSLDDRVTILMGLGRGESYSTIAMALGRHRSTVYREVVANGGRDGYRPLLAHRRAFDRARRPKPTKLAADPELCAWVTNRLQRWWSPEQIARASRREFPHDAEKQVSHETIYKSIYVQGRGELRRELAACLRSGRTKRRGRQVRDRRGRLADMVMISQRPAEITDRAVPGHWEGDLIVGKDNKTAIGTLVERSSRFVMLLGLPAGHGAGAVREALSTAVLSLPEAIRRSLTWDQGSEMAQHVQFTVDTGVDVYFCDPHSPWQRGSNENTNGLLRQYFPKGTDLSVHSPEDLQAAADSLNSRPRKTLGDMTPSQRLAQLVATTV